MPVDDKDHEAALVALKRAKDTAAAEKDKAKGRARRAWRRYGEQIDALLREYERKNNQAHSPQSEGAIEALRRVKALLEDDRIARRIDDEAT